MYQDYSVCLVIINAIICPWPSVIILGRRLRSCQKPVSAGILPDGITVQTNQLVAAFLVKSRLNSGCMTVPGTFVVCFIRHNLRSPLPHHAHDSHDHQRKMNFLASVFAILDARLVVGMQI